jgi:hypothetical protein
MGMQHLSPERIAALVDEPATQDERHHFEQCARCRADFVAVRRIVAAAASERDRPIAPLVPWQQLATALRDEGVLPATRSGALTPSAEVRSILSAPSLQPPVAVHVAARPRSAWQRVAGMAAAAAVLVTAGVYGGRLSMAGSAGTAIGTTEMSPAIAAVQPVAPGATSIPVMQYRSPEDARATLHTAEEVYSGALLWLAAHDSALAPRLPGGSEAAAMTYRQRLEVLDAAMATARRALYEAPDDPVMNRYYLATLGAREVTLRRLTTVLPASQQVLEY